MRGSKRVVGALVVAVLVAVAPASAGELSVAVGQPFRLPLGQQAPGTALGPDGTVWVAASRSAGYAPPSLSVSAHAIGRQTVDLLTVSAPDGFRVSNPVVAVSGSRATIAWELARPNGNNSWSLALWIYECRQSGCRPHATLESWTQPQAYPTPFFPIGDGGVALAADGDNSVVAFSRLTAAGQQLMWAQAGADGRFGVPSPLAGTIPLAAADAFGDPVLTSETGGRILVVRSRDRSGVRYDIEWSTWTAASGFSPAAEITGPAGTDDGSTPVVAASGSGAVLAWVQGDYELDPSPNAGPILFARQTASGISAPKEIYPGDANDLSLSAGGSVIALAFGTPPSGVPGEALAMLGRLGGSFGAPTKLAAQSAPSPVVSVDSGGDTIVVWYRTTALHSGLPTSTTEAAFARAGGALGTAQPLGPGSNGQFLGGGPTAESNAGRTLITWHNPGDTAVFGVLAQP